MSLRPRVLSGIWPPGRLHPGNVLGALDNRVRLQAELDCVYFVTDWHAFARRVASETLVEVKAAVGVA